MQAKSSRLFTGLALATALATFGLIVFGAIVRVTDSGLGCGNHWPLCNGTIFPPLDNLTAWIEWLHRVFALLIGLLGLATLFVAVRTYRSENRLVLAATITAALLYLVQSGLGAVVVIFDLPPTMVTMHLGTAMLLLGALLIAWIGASYRAGTSHDRDHVTLLIYVTTALSLVVILTGALVRGSGATLACEDWPLCNGSVFPFDQGRLQVIHMTHRYAVVALGVLLVLLVWYLYQARQNPQLRRLALFALGVYLLQAVVGAFYVWTQAAVWTGIAHVGLASATWGLLVCLSVVDTLSSAKQGKLDGIYNQTTTA